mgnify:CR=1 FL=1
MVRIERIMHSPDIRFPLLSMPAETAHPEGMRTRPSRSRFSVSDSIDLPPEKLSVLRLLL